MRPGIVADQVKMLSGRGCYAERLFHESVWLVPVAVRALFTTLATVFIAASSAVWRLPGPRSLSSMAASALPFHLSVCQETA